MKKSAFNLRLSQPWLPPKILLIMKLIVVIMTTCLMQVSAAGFAQKITFSKKGATLEQIFTEIRKQTGYYVVYAENKVDKQARLDVNFRNTELKSVLDVISNSQDLEYSFDERNISLKPKEESFVDRIVARFQSIDVRGKVVDSLGNGLAGATVSVKGGKQSTQTAANGDFYLKNVDEGAVLIVSYLGYVAKEQLVSKDFSYIQLQLSTSKLDEVQIMAYGLTSKRLSTGNITTIKAEDIAKQPVDNPLLALMGRVPNLMITPQSGRPGAPISLQLRGQNSLSATSLKSEPLIVINGVPYGNNIVGQNNQFGNANINALSFINPNDIESIDVLADADATSIYGSRGGNGVILITTKAGKAGAMKINANISAGFSEVPKRLDLLNTQEYLALRKEAYKNDGLPIPDATLPSNQKNANNYDLTLWDQNRNTDWQEVFLSSSAPRHTANASISGGNSSVSYLLSGNYYGQGDIFDKNYSDKKGNTSLVLSGNSLDQRLTASMGLNYSLNARASSNSDLTIYAVGLAPNAPLLYRPDGQLNWEPNPGNGRASWVNPYAILLRKSFLRNSTIYANGSINYKVLPHLSLIATGGYTENSMKSSYINPISAQDPSINPTGTNSRNFNLVRSWTFDPQISFKSGLFGGSLDVLAGWTLQKQSSESTYLQASGYTTDALINNLASATSYFSRNFNSYYQYTGIFSRLNYNYQNRYIINLSARRDGSSRFGPGRQFGNFGAGSAAWIFSEEGFFKNKVSFISFGKIRGSYGTSGNDGIPDYGFLELYSTVDLSSYQGLKPILSRGATNPDFGWESVKKAEIAIELGLFNDRLFISPALWRSRSSNQLGLYFLPFTAGNSSVTINQTAKIQNSGADFTFRATLIKTKSWNWSMSGNFGYQRNKLLSFPEGFATLPDIYRTPTDALGKQFYGIVRAYEYKGINPNTGLYEFTSFPEGGADPYANFVNVLPKYTGALTNEYQIGNFNISVFLQFAKRLAQNYLNNYISPGRFTSSTAEGNLPKVFLNRYVNPSKTGVVQKVSTGFPESLAFMRSSDANWVDASFIRVRNISFGYSFPDRLIKSMKMNSVRVHVDAQNVFNVTEYDGFDPEVQGLVLPMLRTYTLGIQIGL
ncbi:SusC/RagA family TonB-linked outer membrane protein [Pedobacter sp. JY14-1]|uniref:SusC/RagA family TonB-linked outer membrane protein n=1 Tax=Pedobacter sp. JY14-1 TaxID=3034151 RepID=UPI0023E24A00|nr:SusC/RagA family TonB-linked outer membrane protein [Pedobacter sp. JY14-1]